MAKKLRTISLADFKKEIGATSLEIMKSRKTSALYATVGGELVAWVAEDCDFALPMIAHEMQDGDEQWWFIGNAQKSVATI